MWDRSTAEQASRVFSGRDMHSAFVNYDILYGMCFLWQIISVQIISEFLWQIIYGWQEKSLNGMWSEKGRIKMGIYICLGGCVILSAIWILSVLMLKRIGLIGMFALGTYLYINQQHTLDTQVQMPQNESGAEQDANGGQTGQLSEISTPTQEPLSTSMEEPSS